MNGFPFCVVFHEESPSVTRKGLRPIKSYKTTDFTDCTDFKSLLPGSIYKIELAGSHSLFDIQHLICWVSLPDCAK